MLALRQCWFLSKVTIDLDKFWDIVRDGLFICYSNPISKSAQNFSEDGLLVLS